jgi:hypothetical protein
MTSRSSSLSVRPSAASTRRTWKQRLWSQRGGLLSAPAFVAGVIGIVCAVSVGM